MKGKCKRDGTKGRVYSLEWENTKTQPGDLRHRASTSGAAHLRLILPISMSNNIDVAAAHVNTLFGTLLQSKYGL